MASSDSDDAHGDTSIVVGDPVVFSRSAETVQNHHLDTSAQQSRPSRSRQHGRRSAQGGEHNAHPHSLSVGRDGFVKASGNSRKSHSCTIQCDTMRPDYTHEQADQCPGSSPTLYEELLKTLEMEPGHELGQDGIDSYTDHELAWIMSDATQEEAEVDPAMSDSLLFRIFANTEQHKKDNQSKTSNTYKTNMVPYTPSTIRPPSRSDFSFTPNQPKPRIDQNPIFDTIQSDYGSKSMSCTKREEERSPGCFSPGDQSELSSICGRSTPISITSNSSTILAPPTCSTLDYSESENLNNDIDTKISTKPSRNSDYSSSINAEEGALKTDKTAKAGLQRGHPSASVHPNEILSHPLRTSKFRVSETCKQTAKIPQVTEMREGASTEKLISQVSEKSLAESRLSPHRREIEDEKKNSKCSTAQSSNQKFPNSCLTRRSSERRNEKRAPLPTEIDHAITQAIATGQLLSAQDQRLNEVSAENAKYTGDYGKEEKGAVPMGFMKLTADKKDSKMTNITYLRSERPFRKASMSSVSENKAPAEKVHNAPLHSRTLSMRSTSPIALDKFQQGTNLPPPPNTPTRGKLGITFSDPLEFVLRDCNTNMAGPNGETLGSKSNRNTPLETMQEGAAKSQSREKNAMEEDGAGDCVDNKKEQENLSDMRDSYEEVSSLTVDKSGPTLTSHPSILLRELEYLDFYSFLKSKKPVRKEVRRPKTKIFKLQRMMTDIGGGQSGQGQIPRSDMSDQDVVQPIFPRGREIPPGWMPGQHGSNPITQISAEYEMAAQQKPKKTTWRKLRSPRKYRRQPGRLTNAQTANKSASDTSVASLELEVKQRPTRPRRKRHERKTSDDIGLQTNSEFERKRRFYEKQQRKRNHRYSGKSSNPRDKRSKHKKVTEQVKFLKTIDEICNAAEDEDGEGEPAARYSQSAENFSYFGEEDWESAYSNHLIASDLANYYTKKIGFKLRKSDSIGGDSMTNMHSMRISRMNLHVPSAISSERLKVIRPSTPNEASWLAPSLKGRQTSNPNLSSTAERWPDFVSDGLGPANLRRPARRGARLNEMSMYSDYREAWDHLRANYIDRSTLMGSEGHVYEMSESAKSDKQRKDGRDRKGSSSRSERVPLVKKKNSDAKNTKERSSNLKMLTAPKLPPPPNRSEEDTWCYSVNAMLLKAKQAMEDAQNIKKGTHRFPRHNSAAVISPVICQKAKSNFLKTLLTQDAEEVKRKKATVPGQMANDTGFKHHQDRIRNAVNKATGSKKQISSLVYNDYNGNRSGNCAPYEHGDPKAVWLPSNIFLHPNSSTSSDPDADDSLQSSNINLSSFRIHKPLDFSNPQTRRITRAGAKVGSTQAPLTPRRPVGVASGSGYILDRTLHYYDYPYMTPNSIRPLFHDSNSNAHSENFGLKRLSIDQTLDSPKQDNLLMVSEKLFKLKSLHREKDNQEPSYFHGNNDQMKILSRRPSNTLHSQPFRETSKFFDKKEIQKQSLKAPGCTATINYNQNSILVGSKSRYPHEYKVSPFTSNVTYSKNYKPRETPTGINSVSAEHIDQKTLVEGFLTMEQRERKVRQNSNVTSSHVVNGLDKFQHQAEAAYRAFVANKVTGDLSEKEQDTDIDLYGFMPYRQNYTLEQHSSQYQQYLTESTPTLRETEESELFFTQLKTCRHKNIGSDNRKKKHVRVRHDRCPLGPPQRVVDPDVSLIVLGHRKEMKNVNKKSMHRTWTRFWNTHSALRRSKDHSIDYARILQIVASSQIPTRMNRISSSPEKKFDTKSQTSRVLKTTRECKLEKASLSPKFETKILHQSDIGDERLTATVVPCANEFKLEDSALSEEKELKNINRCHREQKTFAQNFFSDNKNGILSAENTNFTGMYDMESETDRSVMKLFDSNQLALENNVKMTENEMKSPNPTNLEHSSKACTTVKNKVKTKEARKSTRRARAAPDIAIKPQGNIKQNLIYKSVSPRTRKKSKTDGSGHCSPRQPQSFHFKSKQRVPRGESTVITETRPRKGMDNEDSLTHRSDKLSGLKDSVITKPKSSFVPPITLPTEVTTVAFSPPVDLQLEICMASEIDTNKPNKVNPEIPPIQGKKRVPKLDSHLLDSKATLENLEQRSNKDTKFASADLRSRETMRESPPEKNNEKDDLLHKTSRNMQKLIIQSVNPPKTNSIKEVHDKIISKPKSIVVNNINKDHLSRPGQVDGLNVNLSQYTRCTPASESAINPPPPSPFAELTENTTDTFTVNVTSSQQAFSEASGTTKTQTATNTNWTIEPTVKEPDWTPVLSVKVAICSDKSRKLSSNSPATSTNVNNMATPKITSCNSYPAAEKMDYQRKTPDTSACENLDILAHRGRLQQLLDDAVTNSYYLPAFLIGSNDVKDVMPLVVKVQYLTHLLHPNQTHKAQDRYKASDSAVSPQSVFYVVDHSGKLSCLYVVTWLRCGLYTLQNRDCILNWKSAGLPRLGCLLHHPIGSGTKSLQYSEDPLFMLGMPTSTHGEAITIGCRVHKEVQTENSMRCLLENKLLHLPATWRPAKSPGYRLSQLDLKKLLHSSNDNITSPVFPARASGLTTEYVNIKSTEEGLLQRLLFNPSQDSLNKLLYFIHQTGLQPEIGDKLFSQKTSFDERDIFSRQTNCNESLLIASHKTLVSDGPQAGQWSKSSNSRLPDISSCISANMPSPGLQEQTSQLFCNAPREGITKSVAAPAGVVVSKALLTRRQVVPPMRKPRVIPPLRNYCRQGSEASDSSQVTQSKLSDPATTVEDKDDDQLCGWDKPSVVLPLHLPVKPSCLHNNKNNGLESACKAAVRQSNTPLKRCTRRCNKPQPYLRRSHRSRTKKTSGSLKSSSSSSSDNSSSEDDSTIVPKSKDGDFLDKYLAKRAAQAVANLPYKQRRRLLETQKAKQELRLEVLEGGGDSQVSGSRGAAITGSPSIAPSDVCGDIATVTSDYDMLSDAEEIREIWNKCFPSVVYSSKKRRWRKCKTNYDVSNIGLSSL